jgi:hypothetical protein
MIVMQHQPDAGEDFALIASRRIEISEQVGVRRDVELELA